MTSAGSRLFSSGLTGYAVPNGQLVASCSSNALTVAIKTAGGNDPSPTTPLFVAFRNNASSGGLLEGRTLAAPCSVTVPNGSNFFGTTVGAGFRLWIGLFDDGGTYRLAVNMASQIGVGGLGIQVNASQLVEYGLASSSPTAGAGDLEPQAFFTDTVGVASKPFRIIGFVDFNNGLAGTSWNVQPDVVQMYGPGMHLPGEPVFSLAAMDYWSWTTLNAAIPLDNTTPQATEGTQVVGQSMRPSSKVNVIHARSYVPFSLDAVAHLSGAWFLGGESNARGNNTVCVSAADAMTMLIVDMMVQAKQLTLMGFFLRIGTPTITTTIRVGGRNGSASLFNNSTPIVTEIREMMI